jgi:hypothetical protein
VSGHEKLPTADSLSNLRENLTSIHRSSSSPSPSAQDLTYRYRNWFSLGILEMQVIHRFRNLFMSMMGNLSFVREEIKNGRSPEKFLQDLEQTLSDASDYSNWVQGFSEKQKAALIPINLNGIILESLEVLKNDSHFSIAITFEENRSIPSILADPLLLKLTLWELLNQYTLPSKGSVNGHVSKSIPYITIQLCTTSKESSNSIRPKQEKCVELQIESLGYSIPSAPENHRGNGNSSAASSPRNPAIEVAKSMMRLFRGELKCVSESPGHEKVFLYFPVDSSTN